MAIALRQSGVGLKRPLPVEERVGRLRSTACVETYLRRAFDQFKGGRVGEDVVLLLEMLFAHKVGGQGNKLSSGKQAIIAVGDFLAFTGQPLWHWMPQMLWQYLTDLRAREVAPATIRARHHYINDMCRAILSDRDLANKIQARHPTGSFQQITDEKSRALVKGFGKRKKKLSNPTPAEMQQVFDYLEAQITEQIETGAPIPYVLLRDRVIIALLYAYGVRVSELSNADVTDFDFDPECPGYGDYGIWHIIGKGDKDRHLPVVVDWIFPVLVQYVEGVRLHWTGDPETPDKQKNALFFSNNRTRLSVNSIQRIVKQRFAEAGIKKNVSPHRLRNGCLTRVTDDVGLTQASKIGGHSHAATTEGYYDRKASMSGDALSRHVRKIYKNTVGPPATPCPPTPTLKPTGTD